MPKIEFNHTPYLSEILRLGGRPGFDYALVSQERMAELEMDETNQWSRVGDVPVILVSDKPAYLLATGTAIYGAAGSATVPNYWVDKALDNPTPKEAAKT